MAVRVHDGTHSNFIHTQGITGHYNSGLRFARDGKTLIQDIDEYGQEWQVTDQDPQLFRDVQAPQYPERCIVADSSAKRNLRHGITEKQAIEACSAMGGDVEDCVFDIMATGDLTIVGAHM